MRAVGIFIRDHLKKVGSDYAYRMYTLLSKERTAKGLKPPKYEAFRQLIYILHQLTLIRRVRIEPSSRPTLKPRVYYAIVEGREDSPIWSHPRVTYNPLSILGRRRYHNLKVEAEAEGVDPILLFWRKYPDVVKQVVEELNDIGIKISEDVLIDNLRKYGRSISPKVKG